MKEIMGDSLLAIPIRKKVVLGNIVFIVFMLVIEWLQRGKEHGLFFLSQVKSYMVRYSIVVLIIEFILVFKVTTSSQFIYFQF